jgi:hypothetical protein
MRRVRNHKSSNTSPLAMFAVGVEQVVSDSIAQQSKYDDRELRAMQRSPKKQSLSISIFAELAQYLFMKKAGHRS